MESTKQWQLSPRALIQPPKEAKAPPPAKATASRTPAQPSVSSSSKGTLYKGVFDYTAKQADELSLQVGLLQLEMELTL